MFVYNVALIICFSHLNLSVVVIFGFFFQAEDGIRDLVRSRGLGDVYKRQGDKSSGKQLLVHFHISF